MSSSSSSSSSSVKMVVRAQTSVRRWMGTLPEGFSEKEIESVERVASKMCHLFAFQSADHLLEAVERKRGTLVEGAGRLLFSAVVAAAGKVPHPRGGRWGCLAVEEEDASEPKSPEKQQQPASISRYFRFYTSTPTPSEEQQQQQPPQKEEDESPKEEEPRRAPPARLERAKERAAAVLDKLEAAAQRVDVIVGPPVGACARRIEKWVPYTIEPFARRHAILIALCSLSAAVGAVGAACVKAKPCARATHPGGFFVREDPVLAKVAQRLGLNATQDESSSKSSVFSKISWLGYDKTASSPPSPPPKAKKPRFSAPGLLKKNKPRTTTDAVRHVSTRKTMPAGHKPAKSLLRPWEDPDHLTTSDVAILPPNGVLRGKVFFVLKIAAPIVAIIFAQFFAVRFMVGQGVKGLVASLTA